MFIYLNFLKFLKLLKEKKVFVDYDSMLYDLQLASIKRTKDVYNVSLTYEDIDNWHFFEQYPESIKAYTEWEHYSQGKHFEGAVEFMQKLYKMFGKENVFILTNSHPSLIEKKDKEIERVYGTKNIIHAADKYLITGDNILIDDHCENIEKHVQHNPNGIGILFDSLFITYSLQSVVKLPLLRAKEVFEAPLCLFQKSLFYHKQTKRRFPQPVSLQ